MPNGFGKGIVTLTVSLIVGVLIIVLMDSYGESDPPSSVVIQEHAEVDSAMVVAGVLYSSSGFHIVREREVWEGTYWLNQNGFELVDIQPVTPPEQFGSGSSVVAGLIFVRYKNRTREEYDNLQPKNSNMTTVQM